MFLFTEDYRNLQIPQLTHSASGIGQSSRITERPKHYLMYPCALHAYLGSTFTDQQTIHGCDPRYGYGESHDMTALSGARNDSRPCSRKTLLGPA